MLRCVCAQSLPSLRSRVSCNTITQSWYRYLFSIECPTIAESISSGKIQEWLKNVGDVVEEDEVICQIESDKANVDVRSPKNGTIMKLFAEVGSTVNVGDQIASLEEGPVTIKSDSPAPPVISSPSTTKAEVSAPKQDVVPSKPINVPTVHIPVKESLGSFGTDPRIRHVRVSTMRQRIADRLKASQNTAAMLTTFNEVDMTPLLKIRATYKDEFFKRHNVKLGLMSPFAKACSTALQDIPIVNASWGTDTIEYHDYVDISVAVSTQNGLVVPVIRDVQNMNLAQIESKISYYADRAAKKKLTIPEMTGGTFTISNGGTFGSWMGTPIINPPQSAILGMHAIKKKPWVVDGKIEIRDIMALALTYDHRIIDGRDAVTFLVKVKNIIEDPVRLVLDIA
eukprot:Tbor_TRINITY_DN2499_c0_g1::TRINITY_DN2499_c0_g1_i1::g.2625::m.2625/K00658/DLST, sucB; 2-oxoglutarate dehydrogenase E2 component (dihydrolipoamide succinyltransferase)